jgi:hypothetical protein
MITIKSNSDLNKIRKSDPAHPVMKELINQLISAYTSPGHPYLPENNGYIVLIEQGDVDRALDLPELQCRLVDISWEGVSMRDGFYYAIYLANNEFGISFLIPDAEWVKGELRNSLQKEIC